MRRQDWAFLVMVGAAILTVIATIRGNLAWALGWAVVTAAATRAARHWSRKYPGPMPYLLRWVLLLPRGTHSPQHLNRILEPHSGERILEIGPGVGVHAIPMASSLAPDGSLDVLDAQQAMLDDLMRRATDAGIMNIVPKQGDAQNLPYPDSTFDAAYLIGVLGEIPNDLAALQELRRVLKPNGRLVIGEVIVDPDFISLSSLQDLTRRAGFVFERRLGPSVSYLARFHAARPEEGGRGNTH